VTIAPLPIGAAGAVRAAWARQRRLPSSLQVYRRGAALAAADCLSWVAALVGATMLRYDFHLVITSDAGFWSLLLLAVLTQCLAGLAFGLYTGRWRHGSFEEAYAVGLVVASSALTVTVVDLALGHPIPVSATLGATSPAFLAIAGLRFLLRLRSEPRLTAPVAGTSRVILFGAGDGAGSVISAMLRRRSSPYLPVALLDDDPAKRHLRIHGVPVRGNREALADIARSTSADTLLVAIPSADAELIRDLADRADHAGLQLRVLPSVGELIDGVVEVEDIRSASYADLLGRHEVDIDIESIARYLTGKRVLVTGAGGSIGSELCRQLTRFAPASLVMLDRDESALHSVQLSIQGRALLDSRELVVADIRDRQRLRAVFAEHRPDVVFHAAALKHLPLLEMHPDEAVKTNVWGSWNVLEAAASVGVQRFVNVSTDKAADPISMLGVSKRIAERLTSWYSTRIDGTWLSVRFGNVLGSRGSVLTAFEAQIAMGGPVTVTHPDVTRYFMTVEEAVRLVIQAGAVGRSGEALVLDMGEPVRIVDVARRLVDDSGRDIAIEFSGLRPGEKLHEVLLAEGEPDLRPVHDRISHVAVPALAPADVRGLDPRLPAGDLMALSREVAGASMRIDTGEGPTAVGQDIHDIVHDQSARRRASDPSVMR
jgi:FlaA1/EpsC-like NDP-sugar epimerase